MTRTISFLSWTSEIAGILLLAHYIFFEVSQQNTNLYKIFQNNYLTTHLPLAFHSKQAKVQFQEVWDLCNNQGPLWT